MAHSSTIRAQHPILVVDDDADSRLLAKTIMAQTGYAVTEACSGAEALEAFARCVPACALLDIRLPDCDGVALCKQLRELSGGAGVPIVFMTGLRDIDTFERAVAAGASEFLMKPLNASELTLRVRSLLQLGHVRGELKQQYDIVRAQRESLLRTQLQQEQLSSLLVHDFKGPVNAIDLNAQLLARDSKLTPENRHRVTTIRTEVQSLLRLITGLLDISSSGAGAFSLTLGDVNLKQLAQGTVSTFEAKAAVAEVGLKLEGDWPVINADMEILRRVLDNLVDNAIRHSPPGSFVTISGERAPRSARLCVADAGPGIPMELKDQVFNRFFQTSRDATRKDNYGLGLTFCRMAVEAHGGHVSVEDANPGTRVCISLPAC